MVSDWCVPLLRQIRLWQMGEVMPRNLAAHLESCGVLPALYASPWFLTIFSNEFPISFVGRLDPAHCA